MSFIPSDKVYIYPTANRGEGINPESRLNTEYNITNSVAKLLSFNDGSFVVKWDNTGHIICIHGYFIEITELPSGLTNPIWAHLYYKGEGTSGSYYHQEELAPNSGDNSSIDNDGDFIALELNNSESVSSENNSCWSLQITDGSGNIKTTSRHKFYTNEIATDSLGETSINNTFNTVNLNATNLKANGKEINITGSGDGVTIDTGIYSSDSTAGAEYIVSSSNSFEVVTRNTPQTISGNKTFRGNLTVTADGNLTASGNVLFTNLNATEISGTTTKSLAIDTQSKVKSINLDTSSPTTDGTSLEFIDTISQNSYGKISATKKEITIAAGSNQGTIKINGSDYYINGVRTNNSPSFNGITTNSITTNTINPKGSGETLSLGAYTKVYNGSTYGKGYLVGTENVISYGNSTTPVYVNSSGMITSGSKYAGGTKVTLNGYPKGADTASFYAPTSSGDSGKILKSTGGTPDWAEPQHLYEHRIEFTINENYTEKARLFFTVISTEPNRYIKTTSTSNDRYRQLSADVLIALGSISESSSLPVSGCVYPNMPIIGIFNNGNNSYNI